MLGQAGKTGSWSLLNTNVPFRIALLVLLLITVPYLTAWAMAGPEHSFGGFLLNPVDGNSYLAKMYEGWRGEWRFTLPYTAEPGSGAYVYTFYLALGHLARLAGLPLIGMFHLARLLGTALLLWVLWRFLLKLHPQSKYLRLSFALAGMGLGLGWLVFPFGLVSSDFWVAEAYPFLSAYTNPHFVLSLAILIWLLTIRPARADDKQHKRGATWGEAAVAVLASAALGSMSPFAVAQGLAVLGMVLVWRVFNAWRSTRMAATGLPGLAGDLRADRSFRAVLIRLACLCLGSAPVVLYTAWSFQNAPVLAAWYAQNQTPAPALWDLLLAFSPALLLALLGLGLAWRRSEIQIQIQIGVSWAVLALVMVYLPFGLQRRFLVGLAVPLAALAGFGLERLESRSGQRARSIGIAALIATLPTLLLVVLAGQFGGLSHDPLLYLTRGEAQALAWVESNTPAHALLLAAPQNGLFIPARTGRRVLYGHPFETVNAKVEEAAVTDFFTKAAADPLKATDFLAKQKVDYVFYGPREQLLGPLPVLPGERRRCSRRGIFKPSRKKFFSIWISSARRPPGFRIWP